MLSATINTCSFRVGTFTAVSSLEPEFHVSTIFQNSCSALPSSCTGKTSVYYDYYYYYYYYDDHDD